jgi:hypothetical protein
MGVTKEFSVRVNFDEQKPRMVEFFRQQYILLVLFCQETVPLLKIARNFVQK